MRWLYALVLTRIVAASSPPPTCAVLNTFTYSFQCSLDPESSELLRYGTGSNPSRQSGRWNIGQTCYAAGSDEYCTYTDALFNNGVGISFITTAESIGHIVNRTALQGGVEVPKTEVQYREVEISGKGRGLVAVGAIRAGQTLISRTPAVVLNANAFNGLKRGELDDLLARAVDSLPSTHRDEILELSTYDGSSTDAEKVGKIFRTNSFSTGFHDGKSKFQSLFATVSRINHSCRPNCAYFFDPNTFTQNVVAARYIQPGEELSIAYIDPILPQAERFKKLKAWGFECSCERCSASATKVAESDQNIVEIQSLWQETDNYSSSSRATPAMAERLISLYEKEGLQSRIQEAYYRAALEWIGVGEVEKASEHARLCVKYGTLFKGPGRPFIENMNQLLHDPTGHSHWMFRL
ncbi:hypothetical protein F4859DRAFT_8000 [Xylaria cf. heliscus]|nr:hypothetical protein F4859DRAFT_8000 [Xylaria cf. heliscus]